MVTRAGVETALAAVLAGERAGSCETLTLDFKDYSNDRGNAYRDLAKAAACFANASGGTIVVGVRDNASGVEALAGTSFLDSEVRRRVYDVTEPHLVVDVDIVILAEQRLMTVTVPQSPEIHSVDGRCTERIGTSCVPSFSHVKRGL